MVKDINDSFYFEHNWKDTVEGAINKYPNEFQPTVKSIDIISRKINADGNLVSERYLGSKFNPNSAMKTVMRIIGMPIRPCQYTLEYSSLDVAKKNYTLSSVNKTYFDWLAVHESLEYIPASDISKTRLNQSMQVDMFGDKYSFAFKHAITKGESVFLGYVSDIIPKGRAGLNSVIMKIQAEAEETRIIAEQELVEKCKQLDNLISGTASSISSEISKEFSSELEVFAEQIRTMETEAREVYRRVEAISETIPEKIKNEMEKFESLLRRISSVVDDVKNQK